MVARLKPRALAMPLTNGDSESLQDKFTYMTHASRINTNGRAVALAETTKKRSKGRDLFAPEWLYSLSVGHVKRKTDRLFGRCQCLSSQGFQNARVCTSGLST